MWEIEAAGQFGAAGQALALGALLCLFYDLQRLDRFVFRRGPWFVAVQDVIFFAVAGIAVFCLLLLATNGQPRGYIFLLLTLGFLAVRVTLSRFVMALGRPLRRAAGRLNRTVFGFCNRISRLLERLKGTFLRQRPQNKQFKA